VPNIMDTYSDIEVGGVSCVLGFRNWELGLRNQGVGFRVQGLGIIIQGLRV
jgi:hypothetical protein